MKRSLELTVAPSCIEEVAKVTRIILIMGSQSKPLERRQTKGLMSETMAEYSDKC